MKKVLSACPLFAQIAPQELDGLLDCLGARRKRFEKGGMILAQGDEAGWLGIVLSGGVQVLREDYGGSRSLLARLEAGELFAEVFACADTAVMPVSVMAMEETEVLLIGGRRMLHTCSGACAFHQQLIFNLMRILAAKNLMCNQKIEILSKRTTREKLLHYLMLEAGKAQSSTFEIPFNRQELADYLEADRSGLSAEISKLRREGVLRCERSRFTLLLKQEE